MKMTKTKIVVGMVLSVTGLTIYEIAKTLGYREACNDLNESHNKLVKTCNDSIESIKGLYDNSLKEMEAEYNRALEEEKPEYIFQEFLEDVLG